MSDELQQIRQRLSDYYTPDEVQIWLTSAHPQLNGRCALDLINAGDTAGVWRVIDRLDAAAYL